MLTYDTTSLLRYTNLSLLYYNYYNRLYDLEHWQHTKRLLPNKFKPIVFQDKQIGHIDTILYLASQAGFIEIVKWAFDGSQLSIINNGALNILKYAYAHNLLSFHINVVINAIRHGDLSIIQFLNNIYVIDILYVKKHAVFHKQSAIIEWCDETLSIKLKSKSKLLK